MHPRLLGQFHTGGSGTHRNGYPGGRYVHLAAGMPGFSGNIYVIIDIDDPTHPREVGRWWVPGQHVAGGETPEPAVSLHGPPFVAGDLVYLPYGAAGLIALDISDVSSPRLVGRLDFSPPFVPNIAVHSVPPLPEPPPGAPFGSFYDRGGRFGPHNTNMLYQSPFTNRSTNLIYLAYFNAGLRIFDIKDPRGPEEVGYFIPPDPTHRFGPQPPDALVLQSEDVLVDTRGNIFLSNKNQGLWVLRYTGPS